MTGTSTAAAALHQAMYDAAKTLFADQKVGINYTPTPVKYYDRAITMGGVSSTQDVATMGGTRGRNEDITVVMYFSAYVAGKPETVEPLARDRAFELLNTFAEQIRSALGDTTLGGTVEWCFLTDHEADSIASAEPTGAMWEIEAQFTARYRIRG